MKIIDQREFRNVVGKFPSGVTVITTTTDDGVVHGMTANGFISVSLDPPLVLVSVGKQTKMHERLMQNERYAVSVLRHDQEVVARHFAGRPSDDAPAFSWVDGHPLIEGAISQIGCRMYARHEAGDHTLFVGEVEHASIADDALPLVFSSGQLFSPLDRVPE